MSTEEMKANKDKDAVVAAILMTICEELDDDGDMSPAEMIALAKKLAAQYETTME